MPRPLVLLDFDGVWTDMRGQAASVVCATEAALARLAGTATADAHDALEQVRARVRAAPERFGWYCGERISAFSDEDPYLLHNASMAAADGLALAGDARWQRYRAAVCKAGFESLDRFGSAQFADASHAWLRDHGHDLLPDAVDTMHRLLAIVDVLICTNFSTQAVADSWQRHGIEPALDQGAPFRIRGGARKHELTADPPRSTTLGGREVAVDRGHYCEILRQEQPALVAGDVLSLDLAAALMLRREQPRFAGLELLLVRTPYTPAWALQVAVAERGAIRCVDSLSALLERVERLSRTSGQPRPE